MRTCETQADSLSGGKTNGVRRCRAALSCMGIGKRTGGCQPAGDAQPWKRAAEADRPLPATPPSRRLWQVHMGPRAHFESFLIQVPILGLPSLQQAEEHREYVRRPVRCDVLPPWHLDDAEGPLLDGAGGRDPRLGEEVGHLLPETGQRVPRLLPSRNSLLIGWTMCSLRTRASVLSHLRTNSSTCSAVDPDLPVSPQFHRSRKLSGPSGPSTHGRRGSSSASAPSSSRPLKMQLRPRDPHEVPQSMLQTHLVLAGQVQDLTHKSEERLVPPGHRGPTPCAPDMGIFQDRPKS